MVLKKRWLAIIAVVVICVGAGLMLMRPGGRGLVYKGKTVEEWSVQLYLSQDEAGRNAASAALKELGSKAVPDIVRMLHRKDPFFRRQAWSSAPKLPPEFRKGILSNVKPERAGLVHIAGMRAVAAIGPDAVPVLPELSRILQGKDLQETWEAAYALGAMGPEAVRVLTAALQSEYPAVIQASLAGLKQIGPAAGQAVPAVIEKLGHHDPAVRTWAVAALSGIGQPAVPQLLQIVEHGNGEVRRGAAQALTSILPSRRKFIPVLLEMLKDEEPTSRVQAIVSLTAINGSDQPAIGAIEHALQDGDVNVRQAATNAVAKLQPKEGL
jgi:HEAT repeat protein